MIFQAAPAMSHAAHFADEIMMAISNFPQLEWLLGAAEATMWNALPAATFGYFVWLPPIFVDCLDVGV
jgi:hypothetical protein